MLHGASLRHRLRGSERRLLAAAAAGIVSGLSPPLACPGILGSWDPGILGDLRSHDNDNAGEIFHRYPIVTKTTTRRDRSMLRCHYHKRPIRHRARHKRGTMTNTTVIHYGPLPECDICSSAKARYDAKTIGGPWAYMCLECYKQHRAHERLGTGLGQELTLTT